MELNALESEVLIDIYDADMIPDMPFEIENYIMTVGSRSIKYNNNVTIIYEDKVHIDSKGIKLVA